MKIQYALLLAILITLNGFAQRPKKEKIKTLKIAYITDQLNLTEKEAQAFWPIYNENEDARERLRETLAKQIGDKKTDALTESEAKAHLDAMIKMEEGRLKLHKAYYANLLKILPAKKILALMHADRSFRKKIIEQFKKHHRGHKGDRP